MQPGPAFFRKTLAGFPAGVGFTVEGLRNRRRTADVADSQDFNLVGAAVRGDGEGISNANLPRGTYGLVIELDASEFAGPGGERARLEEARGPEPFVDAGTGHGKQLKRISAGINPLRNGGHPRWRYAIQRSRRRCCRYQFTGHQLR